MPQKSNIKVGIDIGTHHIKVVVLEVSSRKEVKSSKVIGTGFSRSVGLRNGCIVDFDQVKVSIQEAVAMAEEEAKLKIEKAVVAVGGVGLSSKKKEASITLPTKNTEITKSHIDEIHQLCEKKISNSKDSRILHAIPVSYKLDGQLFSKVPLGMRGTELRVKMFFVSCREEHVEALIEVVEECGIEVEDIIASPLVASLVVLSKADRNAGCILALIGSETLSVSVFEHDTPVSLEVFPIGSLAITNDIAKKFKLTRHDAEQLKTGKKNVTKSMQNKINIVIRSRFLDIFKRINGHIKRCDYDGVLWAGIILTGGASAFPELDTLARLYLKLPARVVKPFFPGNNCGLGDNAWSEAYGICVMAIDEGALK
jgi:cell division protein FtsA